MVASAITPESFPLVYSIFFLAAVIVGGMGTILGSILGAVFMTMVPELLKLIRGHTSTIVFVNNRRGAERLAKRLNELAREQDEEELPATEHGGHAPAAPGRGSW